MKLLGLVFMLSILEIAASCSFGGCGCGCGGRKKRSVESLPPLFTNLSGKGDQMLCNSPELKAILLRTMKDEQSESGKSIAAHLEAAGDRYVVVCSEDHFYFFIHPDMEFCGARNSTHHCQAFAL